SPRSPPPRRPRRLPRSLRTQWPYSIPSAYQHDPCWRRRLELTAAVGLLGVRLAARPSIPFLRDARRTFPTRFPDDFPAGELDAVHAHVSDTGDRTQTVEWGRMGWGLQRDRLSLSRLGRARDRAIGI